MRHVHGTDGESSNHLPHGDGSSERSGGDRVVAGVGASHAMWCLFQVAVPLALTISLSVSFVLIPVAFKKGGKVQVFWQVPSQVMHNVNLVFVITECIIEWPMEAFERLFLFSPWWRSRREILSIDCAGPVFPKKSIK